MDKEFEPEVKSESEEFLDGFNVKTIIAGIFIGLVMLPGSIYLGLITGGMLPTMWVTMILFVEIAKRSFIKLKKQEIYIIGYVAATLVAAGMTMGAASLVLKGGIFSEKIWQQYFIRTPQAHHLGIDNLIPSWVVPSPDSGVLTKRTFLDSAWIVPLLILVGSNILFRLTQFGLGYILFRITSDVERLEFPMAPVAAEGVMALEDMSAKKDSMRMQVFTIAGMIGIVYGLIYVVIPTLTGLVAAKPLMLIPIPWVDATAKISGFLPGAILGSMTDLGFLFAGFVLPFWVMAGGFIGSILANVVGNPILHKFGLIPHWTSGMDVRQTVIATKMDFWISVTIGLGIVVALIGIGGLVISSIKKRISQKVNKVVVDDYKPPEGRGDIPIWLALGIWIFATIGYILLCHKLVPSFPVLLLILFGFVLTPLLSYISARLFGIAGMPGGISFPYLREGIFIKSGFSGVAIWFAPIPFFNVGAYTQKFKELELTRTKLRSLIKAEIFSFVVMAFCSFLFWEIIWRMGPIPAAAYAYVNKMWPLTATFQALWVSTTIKGGSPWMLEAIKLPIIAWSGILGLGVFGLIGILKLPVTLFYGMIAGVTGWWPHHIIPMFIGALLGRFYFAKKFGEKRWRSFTPLLVAGYACGVGLIAMISVAIALIFKSVSQIIF